MSITFKASCPCGDFDFTLKYNSPSDEPVQIYCPFCGVEIEDKTDDVEEEDDYEDYDSYDYDED